MTLTIVRELLLQVKHLLLQLQNGFAVLLQRLNVLSNLLLNRPRARRILKRVQRFLVAVGTLLDAADHNGLSVSSQRILEQASELGVAIRDKLFHLGVAGQHVDAIAESEEALVDVAALDLSDAFGALSNTASLTACEVHEREFALELAVGDEQLNDRMRTRGDLISVCSGHHPLLISTADQLLDGLNRSHGYFHHILNHHSFNGVLVELQAHLVAEQVPNLLVVDFEIRNTDFNVHLKQVFEDQRHDPVALSG